MWFLARLFAAWAAITLMAGVVLGPMTLFGIYTIDGNLYVAGSLVGPFFMLARDSWLAVCYFLGGYFAFRFFRESWLKVGLGIPFMNYAIVIWTYAWHAILDGHYPNVLFYPTEVLVVLDSFLPLMITVGVLARHLLPPGQIRARINLVVRLLRRWPDKY